MSIYEHKSYWIGVERNHTVLLLYVYASSLSISAYIFIFIIFFTYIYNLVTFIDIFYIAQNDKKLTLKNAHERKILSKAFYLNRILSYCSTLYPCSPSNTIA